MIPDELLNYAQIIKQRTGHVLTGVEKRAIFGEYIDPKMLSTSYIERQNLTRRQVTTAFRERLLDSQRKKTHWIAKSLCTSLTSTSAENIVL
jgi:hypothetical protein